MSTTIRHLDHLKLCISIGDYYEWEKSREIYVNELIGIGNNDLERFVLSVKDAIKILNYHC